VVKSFCALRQLVCRFECWLGGWAVGFGAKKRKFKKQVLEPGFRYEATDQQEGVVCFSKLCAVFQQKAKGTKCKVLPPEYRAHH
jgi:hypothetical protein